MTLNTFPQIRTLSLTMLMVLSALIIDVSLKNVSFGYDLGSMSQQWLNRTFASLADKLLGEMQQSPSSPVAPVISTEALRGIDPRTPAPGVAAMFQVAAQNKTRKTRVCVAPATAQLGQGNSVQADYGTSVKNALVLLMSGPAVDVNALDASVPVQMDAEARQKDCDYVLIAAVTVKRTGSSGLSRLMKAGSMAASLTPMGIMAHSVGGMIAAQAATTAMQSAALTAQQQAVTQLSGFNGQIKSKDEVTVQYELFATGQSQPRMQNVLKGKSRTDGEDVLSPLLRDAATGVMNEVVKPGE